MSIIDKVAAAITPTESEGERRDARAAARAAASPGDWLSQILDHHEQIDAAFEQARSGRDANSRVAAQKQLAILLAGHSIAEEVAIYPALARADEEGHATMAYTEQSAAKMQMGLLENLDPMSQEYLDKLEHIRGAVLHHVFKEEGNWYVDLRQKLPEADQQRLTERYREEFERYMGGDADALQSSAPSSATGMRQDRGGGMRPSTIPAG